MFSMFSIVWTNRVLTWRLARREIEARFRGSFLGVFWAAIMPLAMLGIYSFVFGGIFNARWVRPEQPGVLADYGFPLVLFSGLMVFGILSEPLSRSPGLIMENVSYVKKVVFPLEVLPFVALISALINMVITLAVFLAVFLLFHGLPPATILFLPIVLLPVMLMTLGIVYLLSSLGVFLRDLKQVMPILTAALLFLAPVFYPLSVVPEAYRSLMLLNPLTLGVLFAQDVIFWGRLPDPLAWGGYLLASILVFAAGSWWFLRTKKAFADVL
ncbi:MAG TPA: ABC transporter permease [Aurantimonas sp.]|jgi:lipopolysaccharide transport system permease protein|nr:ABC transporter permease [Aurantimonas sp.]